MGYSSIGRGDGLSLGHPRRMGTAHDIGSPPHATSPSIRASAAQHSSSWRLIHSHRWVQCLAPTEKIEDAHRDESLHQVAGKKH